MSLVSLSFDFALSALGAERIRRSWAVGPGCPISRPWRFAAAPELNPEAGLARARNRQSAISLFDLPLSGLIYTAAQSNSVVLASSSLTQQRIASPKGEIMTTPLAPLGFRSTLLKTVVLTMLLLTILLALSCRGGDDATERAVNLDAACDQASATVTLPDGAGVGLLVQVKRDSQCPVNVHGLSQFTGSISPGNVVQRSQETGENHREVKLDCGDNKELKCKYSYLKLTRPRQAATLAEEDVATTCDKGDTVISLGGGNFTVDVTVLGTSECPVDVSGVGNNPETVAPGKTQSFNKIVDAGKPPIDIKLSCGTSATKNCKYKYSLKKN